MPEYAPEPYLLSLLIPVYNEAATLPPLWERLQKVAWPCPVEFVLVDDGSTDGSREVIGRLEAPRVVRVLTFASNVLTGI
ncbi:MAG: glycosyltransferase [Planctomycetes bacterium]|nr:glycosyltransferase [Planctomycetota bacterium]